MKNLITLVLILLCSCTTETTTVEEKKVEPSDTPNDASSPSPYENNGEDYNTIVNCYWQRFIFDGVVYKKRFCINPDPFPWKNLPDPPPDIKIKQHENR